MKVINIRGYKVIIDEEDYLRVSKEKWYPYFNDIYGPYIKNGKGLTLGRFILNPPKNLDVDHINRKPLDNRKSNLRVATRSQNKANVKKYKNNKSGFKGVWLKKDRIHRTKMWSASTSYKGKTVHFGNFNTPEEAAKAYDKNVKKLFKEFALTNF
ncbi:MAG: HNH endonuclease [Nanoarchaeota archaeon]